MPTIEEPRKVSKYGGPYFYVETLGDSLSIRSNGFETVTGDPAMVLAELARFLRDPEKYV